jgi:prephenate dehydratase
MPKLATALRVTVMDLEQGLGAFAGALGPVSTYQEGYRTMSSTLSPTAIVNPAQDNPVIAFQGVLGAYSHLAAHGAFPAMEPLACPTFQDAFAAVEEGRAGLAMIPIENSLGGRVADIHHLLPESNLFIIGEYFQPVHHCLLVPKGGTFETVKEAHSHEQALAQCRNTLRELKIKPVIAADTAGAAQAVAKLNDPSVAAVASSLAAETYGLDILRPRIEDRIGNVTRFVVMSRTRIEPDPRSGPCLTSFVFTVRSVPAALYKSLGGFATNGVNMIKLESYISVGDDSRARFYAEIEGHPADKSVDQAMEELQFFTSKIKLLGTYRQADYRAEE